MGMLNYFDDDAVLHMLGYLKGSQWRDALKQKPELKDDIKVLIEAVNKRYHFNVLEDCSD